MNAAELTAIAARANLAPSVHNTQPTRWRFAEEALWLLGDDRRRLKVGDPQGRDLRVSVGAALEGTAIALAEQGLAAVAEIDERAGGDLVSLVRIETRPGATPDPLAAFVPKRLTWRRGFAPAALEATQQLAKWADGRDDIGLVHELAEVREISELNERTSLAFYRNTPYREELLGWMRLSASNPQFGVDGLSAPALGMTGFEAFGAGLALRQPLFGLLDGLGLLGGLVSEQSRTMAAAAVLLLHRPREEHPVETGRALYRRLLELASLGFQTWPMSVLADNPDSAAELCKTYGLAEDRRLITAWRVGVLPAGATAKRERLPADALIV